MLFNHYKQNKIKQIMISIIYYSSYYIYIYIYIYINIICTNPSNFKYCEFSK